MSQELSIKEQLMQFYQVKTDEDLINAQAIHIQKLQAALAQYQKQPVFLRGLRG